MIDNFNFSNVEIFWFIFKVEEIFGIVENIVKIEVLVVIK